MKSLNKLLAFIAVSLSLALSCTEEAVVQVVADSSVSVVLDTDGMFPDDLKSSVFADGAEDLDSGYQVVVYNESDALVESVYTCLDSSSGNISLKAGNMYSFYLLGNYWLIDKQTGEHVPFPQSFFASLSDVENLSCRFDGKDTPCEGLRYERFEELSTLGIPYACVTSCTVHSNGQTVSFQGAKRLLSRVDVTIDHSGMDTQGGADCFMNRSVKLRNAASCVNAFRGYAIIDSGDDVMYDSDCLMFSTNEQKGTWTFYVPENMQGSRPDIVNAAMRTPLNAPQYATYMEFEAEIDRNVAGYGGNVCYRFYLGRNNTDDFNFQRNIFYRVVMTFSPDALFSPDWRVEPGEDFVDNRLLIIDKTGSGQMATFMSDDDYLVLRPSDTRDRPRRFNLYYNPSGMEGNNRIDDGNCIGSYVPGLPSRSLSESYVYFAPDTQEHQNFLDHGIAVDYQPGSDYLSLYVSDPLRFHPGEEYALNLILYPGQLSRRVIIRTKEDMSISMDTDEFYVGMKRKVSFSGFVNEPEMILSGDNFCKDAYLYACSPQKALVPAVKSADPFYDPVGSGETFGLAFDIILPQLSFTSDRLLLPMDGTGKQYEVKLYDRHGNELNKNLFDSQLYAEILQPSINIIPDSRYGSFAGLESDMLFCNDIIESASYPGRSYELGTLDARSGINELHATISLYTKCPSVSGSIPDVESDYFNTFISDGSLRASWPSITSGQFQIDEAGCELTNLFRVDSGTMGTRVSSGTRQAFWEWKPSSSMDDAFSPPYGQTSYWVGLRNVRSGRDLSSRKTFVIKHNVNVGMYAEVMKDSPYGDVFFGAPLSLSYLQFMDYPQMRNPYNLPFLFSCYSVSEESGRYENARSWTNEGWSVPVFAASFDTSSYSNLSWQQRLERVVFSDSLCGRILSSSSGWPTMVRFRNGNGSSYVPDSNYGALKDYIRISVDSNPKRLGYRVL